MVFFCSCVQRMPQTSASPFSDAGTATGSEVERPCGSGGVAEELACIASMDREIMRQALSADEALLQHPQQY